MEDITARRIKELRKELKLSQEELAAKTGYRGKSSISQIEKTSRNVTIDNLKLFANALGCTPDYLMGWSNDRNGKAEMVVETDKIDYALRLPDKPRTEREALLDALNIELVIMDESRLKRLQKYAELINRGDL